MWHKLQFTDKRSPNVNVQWRTHENSKKYNLWIKSVYCTEKLRQFKEAKKEKETVSTADLGTVPVVHEAWPSPEFFL